MFGNHRSERNLVIVALFIRIFVEKSVLIGVNVNVPIAANKTVIKSSLVDVVLFGQHGLAFNAPALANTQQRSLLHKVALLKSRHHTLQERYQSTNARMCLNCCIRTRRSRGVCTHTCNVWTIQRHATRLSRKRENLVIPQVLFFKNACFNSLTELWLQLKILPRNHRGLKEISFDQWREVIIK